MNEQPLIYENSPKPESDWHKPAPNAEIDPNCTYYPRGHYPEYKIKAEASNQLINGLKVPTQS